MRMQNILVFGSLAKSEYFFQMIKSNIPRDLQETLVRPNDVEAVVKGAVTVGINRSIEHPSRSSRYSYLLYFPQPFDKTEHKQKVRVRVPGRQSDLLDGGIIIQYAGFSINLNASSSTIKRIYYKEGFPLVWMDRIYISTANVRFVKEDLRIPLDLNRDSKSCYQTHTLNELT
jgi:hypothetical protein